MYKIATANFPFVDAPAKTMRTPVVVLTKARGMHSTVIVAYITTNTDEILDSDIILNKELPGFKDTGLLHTSLIRLHKVTSLSLRDIEYEIGVTPDSITFKIIETLQRLFRLS